MATSAEERIRADAGRRRAIRPLSPLLVNQIAAGEVVERPASVVKELVDNSLDAGAARISVTLEGGGLELIRVTDDGVGVEAADLPLMVAPHATSKIVSVEDLDAIQTMGFRGEALASIASVARLSVRSRTADSEQAARLDVEGGVEAPVRPDGGPVGTSVTVRNLFYNTPARRKFLRTAQTEQGHCLDVVKNLAAAHAHVGFTVKAGERVLLDAPPGQSPRERAVTILGAELADELVEVNADEFDDSRGLSLWGLIGLPSVARPTTRGQRVFVNGRPIRDRTIQHALQEAYRGLIEPSRKPTALILVEMAPAAVDVNVHPTKAEVRFRDQGLVHSVVLRAVRDALSRADLTPSVSLPGASFGAGRVTAEEFVEQFKRLAPGPGGSFPFSGKEDGGTPLPAQQIEARGTIGSPVGFAQARQVDRVLQVHNSYLVTQDEQGVVIIDQHALHERVMFERLLDRMASGPLESQRLLTPAVVSTTSQRVDRLEDLGPLLTRLGVEASAMGPTDIGIHSFPSFLFEKGVEPADFLAELLERAETDGLPADEEEALRETLDMMACKAAVKAGDRLSEEELSELVSLRDQVERSSRCPHGRPTTIRLTIEQLERLFGRR
jgi:DNA mismatch repair protein MutL